MNDLENLKKTIEEDYARKVNTFRLLPITGKDILIGDSMIAFMLMRKYGFDRWQNMGIAGDTTIGVMNRLDAVIRQKPKRVILSIGSNDLVLTNDTIDEITSRIHDLISVLKSHNIDIYYLLVTPVCPSCEGANQLYIGSRTNEDIFKLNQSIIKALHQDKIIDTYSPFINRQKELNPIYSRDGIHLNDVGYQLFSKTIHDALS